MQFFYTYYPQILLLAIGCIVVAIYRLRTTTLERDERQHSEKDAINTLYRTGQELQQVRQLLETGEAAEALPILSASQAALGRITHEQLSTLEWKNYLGTLQAEESCLSKFVEERYPLLYAKRIYDGKQAADRTQQDDASLVWFILVLLVVIILVGLVTFIFATSKFPSP